MPAPLLAASVTVGIGAVIRYLIVAFGIGIVSFLVLQNAIDLLQTQIEGSIGGIPSDILGILNLAGILDGMSIIFAAITTRTSFVLIKRLRVGVPSA